MRNVNLASYGVEELNEVQMREVNGGFFLEFLLGYCIGAALVLYFAGR